MPKKIIIIYYAQKIQINIICIFLPSYLFKTESFLKYTKIFYPKFTNIKYFENDTIVDISNNTDSGYNFSIDDIVGKNKNNILTL